jgi:phage portal protein BeeE
VELDLSGLLRGDPAQRWQSWKIAVDAGILDADEIREEEGFNPRGAPAIT